MKQCDADHLKDQNVAVCCEITSQTIHAILLWFAHLNCYDWWTCWAQSLNSCVKMPIFSTVLD